MTKSNELRIGNWVLNYGQYVCVEADDIVDCHHQPESYDPIPLTPEILEKAGFKKNYWNNSFYPGRFSLSLFEMHNYKGDAFFEYDSIDNILMLLSSDGGDTSTVIEKIQFLHQLQNLYFAITGEELEIDLTPTVPPGSTE
jgi:hypothetical protein